MQLQKKTMKFIAKNATTRFCNGDKDIERYCNGQIIKYSNKKAREYIKQRMLTCLNKKLIKQFNSLIL